VYAKGQSIKDLTAAYAMLTESDSYQSFVRQVAIDGTWDDHDMGVNDGGRKVSDKLERAMLYMKFLNSGKTVRQGKQSKLGAHIAEREGIYHSRTVKNKYNGTASSAKFLFLDTRFMRDHHYVRSLGEIKLPLTALFAAAFRTMYSVLGFGRAYDGDVLGDKQWRWLETELAKPSIDYHVIVSSIQVFTSNPAVESWGHFPLAKRRLVDLLNRHHPKGLVFLSGDVHHGETVTVPAVQGSEWLEVTSSGLTHSANDGLVNGILCPLMHSTFSQHRRVEYGDEAFVGRNFGQLQFDHRGMNLTVRSLETGEMALLRTVKPEPAGTASGIIDFPLVPVEATVALATLVFICFIFVTRRFVMFLSGGAGSSRLSRTKVD
jgi:alkaline phosphatase D